MNTRIKRVSAAFFALCMLCAGSAFADRTDIGSFPNTNTFESYTGPITNFFNGWYASADDQSEIVASNYTYTACSKPVPSATHNRVLQLKTQGTTLTNKITQTSVASQLAYVDIMVKFEVSLDKPPELTLFSGTGSPDIKAAVYLDTNKNLVVYHGVDTGGGVVNATAVSPILTQTLSTDQWYRVTLVYDARGSGEDGTCEMFQVKIDGVPVTNSAAYDDGWLQYFTEHNGGALPATSETGTWFRSAQVADVDLCKSVTAIAFQGKGYFDDLLVTTQSPSYTYDASFFTLTLNLGPHGSHSAPGNSIQVASGDTTNITFTADGWYLIDALTNNGSAVGAAHDAQSYLLAIGPVSSDRSVDATFYLKQYLVTPDAVANSTRNPSSPWMVDRGASAEAVYTASPWYRVTGLTPGGVGAGNSIATAQVVHVTSATNLSATVTKLADQTYGSTTVPTDWFLGWASGTESLYDNSPLTVEQEYLLNVNPFISETAVFAIKGITVVDPDVNVEVGLQINSADHTNIIGHLTLLGTPGLPATTWTTNGTPLNGDVFTNGTYTFTFPTNFNTIFKAEIK